MNWYEEHHTGPFSEKRRLIFHPHQQLHSPTKRFFADFREWLNRFQALYSSAAVQRVGGAGAMQAGFQRHASGVWRVAIQTQQAGRRAEVAIFL